MNKTPTVRFKGFTEDWERRKLGDITVSYSGGTPKAGNIEYYGGAIPFIRSGEISKSQTELFITESGLENSSAAMVNKGDILYALYGATSGEVSISKMEGAINQAILAILPKKEYDSNFLMQWLQIKKDFIIATYLQGGQGNLSGTIVKNLIVDLPRFVEQTRIGSTLADIDNLISLHQRKYEKLKNIKKSMLYKMFPQNGSKVPEIRFAGFTGDWEQRKLKDIASSFEYGLNAAAKEFDGVNKYLRITDIDDASRAFRDDDVTSPDANLSLADNYRLQKGDVLFARTGASVGKSYIYRKSDGLVYFAGFLIRARIKPEYSEEFIFQNTLTTQYEKYIQFTSQRSGQPGVNAQEYGEYSLLMPDYQEQKIIGNILHQIDNLIILHHRKLEKLEQIKQAMLHKMFV